MKKLYHFNKVDVKSKSIFYGNLLLEHIDLENEVNKGWHLSFVEKFDKNEPQLISVNKKNEKPIEVLVITSYPPRECGIATYSQDLIKSISNKFSNSLTMKVCALETSNIHYKYPEEVKYVLNTSLVSSYEKVAEKINADTDIGMVLIQHEFGFYKKQEDAFLKFICTLTKPISIVFHTVLSQPDEELKIKVRSMSLVVKSMIVMTQTSSDILTNEYGIEKEKITVIPHGTHLVLHESEEILKEKYDLSNRKVITTFGLLSSGKSIETTLDSLPEIIKTHPEVIFLLIGKTHPEVLLEEGEKYREMLVKRVEDLNITNNVRFINQYLPLPELLEYLQLTDIYVFSTNDPNQAVSGTFSYAMSCACPIISTPIPHAKEVLTSETGIIFDFRNSAKLSVDILKLLNDEELRRSMSLVTLQKISSTAWENSAILHALLFKVLLNGKISLRYNNPDIKLDHIFKMTDFAMVQFSKINIPDIETGYTLDDNARALIVMCMHYSLTSEKGDLVYIDKYLSFIESCLQSNNVLLNYMDKNREFTKQNNEVDLNDSNGRAIWALGYLVSLSFLFPFDFSRRAKAIIEKVKSSRLNEIESLRSMAFAIKGLYYYQRRNKSIANVIQIERFANRLVQSYQDSSDSEWRWFEEYMTYANSILPEALLCAWKVTGNIKYRDIAITSFNFLLDQTFNENGIEVISNLTWFQKGSKQVKGKQCEQPIDVAYTIMALDKFYDETHNEDYRLKMDIAFNWFLGYNRLHQIVYNPITGGCYDGLEEDHVNLNQGAESTLSYLLSRLTIQNRNKKNETYEKT